MMAKMHAPTDSSSRATQRAYSYIRFSSPEQAKGDSLRRQTELAAAYAKEHGMELDTGLTFRDLGISAFSGQHRTSGALAAFIDACKSGKVPRGSALLVESLDRLSREEVRKALRQLLELIDDLGIEVHTLGEDKRVFGPGTEMVDLMMAIIIMARSHEESASKSYRMGEIWRKKKAETATQPLIAITAKVPTWIKAEKGKPMQLIPERAAIVREIFDLAISGLGANLIAQEMNAKHPNWNNDKRGNGWHKSTVEKILRHPATYGAYVPYRRTSKARREAAGEAVTGYFPAAIDYATYQAAQDARTSRYRERRGRTDTKLRNLFAGLVTDAELRLPMVYYWRGNELVTNSYRFGRKPHRISYSAFESAFLMFLDQLDPTTVLDIREGEELKRSEHIVSSTQAKLADLRAQAERLADLYIKAQSSTLEQRLRATEADIRVQEAALAEAERSVAALRAKHYDLLDKSEIYAKLAESRDLKTRARLREEIRRKVARIEFVAFDVEYSEGDLQEEFKAIVRVLFVNGAMRMMGFTADERVILVNLDFRLQ